MAIAPCSPGYFDRYRISAKLGKGVSCTTAQETAKPENRCGNVRVDSPDTA
ncbi:hypothetical protein [Pseudodesulfovibrio methanolicus]|uniref:Uncharacterized protein n=1 Tax=Pseudodesulfovibrio methanolicus TaxID=3126690 RepID=A0ABZ2J2S4_9BACT